MDEDSLIATLRAIAERLEIGYSQLGSLAGVSPSTMRLALLTGRAPVRVRPRKQLEAFALANRDAHRRTDLRVVG